MTYQEAEELGRACGLECPAEFVNNVTMHADQLFFFGDMDEQIKELIESAKLAGVQFSKLCGDAILEGAPVDELCYICKKFAALGKP